MFTACALLTAADVSDVECICLTGDGAEEQRCADERQWPFVKVNLQSKPEVAAKIVDKALAAFPTNGGLLTNMRADHLTSLWSDS